MFWVVDIVAAHGINNNKNDILSISMDDGLLFKNELLTVHVKTQEPLPSIVKSERLKSQHPSLPRESHPIPQVNVNFLID